MSEAFAALRSLAETLGIPVVTTVSGKGAIEESHELAMGVAGRYSRRCANEVLRAADTILALGTRFNDMTTDRGRAIDPLAAIAHINIDPGVLGRNRREGVSVLADIGAALGQLLEALDGQRTESRWADWRSWCVRARDGWLQERAAFEVREAARVPVAPACVVAAMRNTLGVDDVVVSDTGYMAAWTSALFDVARAGRGHIRAAGSLGWGLPAAVGAQIALGSRGKAVCVTGDGGIGYHFFELETAVRLRLPLVVVLMNNGTLAFEYQTQRKVLDTEVPALNDFADVDYAAAARALGAAAERIDDPAQVESALRSALGAGVPTLLDIRTDRDARAPVTSFEAIEERPL